MFEGYKPTKQEATAIERGFRLLAETMRNSYRIEQCARDEKRGYGNASDRIPLAAARGICCKWFIQGWNDPEMLLRRNYFCRPAAIYMTGLGADMRNASDIRIRIGWSLACATAVGAARAAADAHETAFKRMQKREAPKPAIFIDEQQAI